MPAPAGAPAAVRLRRTGLRDLLRKDLEAAVKALGEALRKGFDGFKLIRVDSDLSSLRDHPEFRAILQAHGLDDRGDTTRSGD